jgi:hypothetical protein
MNHIERDLLCESKEILEKRPMEFFQEHVRDCLETEYPCRIDWVLLFQKLYLHACLKGKRDAAEWLTTDIYERLDPIQKIALRQVFPYGRYLLSRR